MSETILAVGASGKFGGLVLPALAGRGFRLRGLLRKPEDERRVRDHGADEVAIGDLTDPASVARALEGVGRVFYMAPVALPDEAETGRAFVAAAARAGIRRIVFSSVIHPVLAHLPNHALKAPVEEAILDSGLEYTLLHPTVLFQNFAAAWPDIVKTGVLAEPWSNDTRFSRVDFRDVAEAATIALTTDRLLYGTFELCAPGWPDRHEVAALIAGILGRHVEPRRIDPDHVPPPMQALRPMLDHYDRLGLRGNHLTLAAILEREPRTLRAYFAELAAAVGNPDRND